MIRKKFKKILFMGMLVLGCVGLLCANVEAATYYVAPPPPEGNGVDPTEENPVPGTIDQPWQPLTMRLMLW